VIGINKSRLMFWAVLALLVLQAALMARGGGHIGFFDGGE
jgi:hypothetical protein